MKRSPIQGNHLDKAFLAAILAVLVLAATRLVIDLIRWIG